MKGLDKIASSYKDPDASVYTNESGEFFRVFSNQMAISFQQFLQSEAYELTKKYFPALEVIESDNAKLIVKTEKLPFISYFYEWSFDMLKDAALFYLEIQKTLIQKGYILVDASPSNISFRNAGSICHFDIGSVRPFSPEEGWIGFRQFIESFLYPLYVYANPEYEASNLQSFVNTTLNPSLQEKLIPFNIRTKPSYLLLKKLYKSISAEKKSIHADKKRSITEKAVYNNFVFFETIVKGIKRKATKTTWSAYYAETILSQEYSEKKEKIIHDFFDNCSQTINTIVDWGANNGKYSELAAIHFKNSFVIATDSDNRAINDTYQQHKRSRGNILPIIANLLNPSPALGWMNGESKSLQERMGKKAGLQMGLAIVHHLQHRLNLPFTDIAVFFKRFANQHGQLIVEYVAPTDPNCQLISNPNYPHDTSEQAFAASFKKYFTILMSQKPCDTRTLYLMELSE